MTEVKEDKIIECNIPLTADARERLAVVSAELQERLALGLATSENLAPKKQVERFLKAIQETYPLMDRYTDAALAQIRESFYPETKLVVLIPVVGFGDQEQDVIIRTLDVLSKQALIQTRQGEIWIYINRPMGTERDNTKDTIEAWRSNNPSITLKVFEGVIAATLGRNVSPFYENLDELSEEVPIALMRDVLNIVCMKSWIRSNSTLPPIVLQVDSDLWSLEPNTLSRLLDIFTRDPFCQFVQCTTNWDGPLSTDQIPALLLGNELMRELPMILKQALNRVDLEADTLLQVIFGESIQRGIQVPQAERLESIAKKGSYGLLSLSEDELDLNIRMTALSSGLGSLQASPDILFYFSNRRALAAWIQEKQPPISQWVIPFTGEDRVRRQEFDLRDFDTSLNDILLAVNRTLARFPIPYSLAGVYDDFKVPITKALYKCGIPLQEEYLLIQQGQDGTYILQLRDNATILFTSFTE